MASYVLFFVLLVVTFITSGCCDSTAEATVLALETSGELLAPQSLVQKFTDELKAIRTAYPQVNNVVHSSPWTVGELIATVSDEQLERILAKYGQVTSSRLFGELKVLKFTAQYNPVVLAKELIAKNLVTDAEPNTHIGEGDSIRYDTQTGVYHFSHGWGDCPSGCISHHYWQISSSPSSVVKLISESGEPLKSDEN